MTSDIKDRNQSRQHGRVVQALRKLVNDEARALCGWALVIGAALIGFVVSEGFELHQFAIGALLSSASLFIAMALFEGLWRAFAD